MGWNTAALFVRHPSRVVLEALECAPTEAELRFDEASLGRLAPNLACAEIGNWTALWDPGGEIAVHPDSESLRRSLSQGARSLAVLWASTASQYGFRYYMDGELIRAVLYEHGEVVDEEGDPLEEEEDIDVPSWGPDEDWCLVVVERLTRLSFRRQARARYRVVEPVRSTGSSRAGSLHSPGGR